MAHSVHLEPHGSVRRFTLKSIGRRTPHRFCVARVSPDLPPLMVSSEEAQMKYSLSSIPVEVLALAFIEFTFVSVYAAVVWYVLGGK